LIAFQQLHIDPKPAAVGQEMVVRATQLQATQLQATQPQELAAGDQQPAGPMQVPAKGVEVSLELPDRSTRVLGVTGADGLLRFAATEAGSMSVSANIANVRCVAAFVVAPARKRWLLALVSVPLGLALLWVQVRRLLAAKPAA
jgi:hypothetical protein